MEGLGCLIFLASLIPASILIVMLYGRFIAARKRREHRQITAEVANRNQAHEGEVPAMLASAFWLRLREEVPFLPTPKPEALTAEGIYDAIAATLGSFPSVARFADVNLPVPLPPEAERRRHLYVVGKTGSGKTTFLEHLIAEDLAAGRGVGVIAPEGEFFARLLAMVPKERRNELIYFAPGNPECPLSFNPLSLEPGEDASRAAEDLFTIFKRSLADDELGPRMQPILQNSFAALIGRPGAALPDIKRLLDDATFRYEIASTSSDQYVREFWIDTYPRYPKGSDLPILNRLDQFLRPAPMRRCLGRAASSFSVRKVLADGQILFLDLFGLSQESRLVFGQLLLAKIQLELMRRELAGAAPGAFHLYCDELQAVAGTAEGLWRDLLSRGRKYGLAITAASQHPGQLPTGLQAEIFGNVASLVSFALGNKDAQAVRKELLVATVKKDAVRAEPIDAAELIELPVGQAYAKLAGGRAFKMTVKAPERLSGGSSATQAAIRESWKRFAAPPEPVAPVAPPPAAVREPESFLE